MSDSVSPSVARIEKITLSDYRAFPGGETYEFNLTANGKNLLLFGENGSGKTSLFRALQDLTTIEPGPVTFADSRYLFGPKEDGHISIQLTSGAPAEFRWDHDDDHPRVTGGVPYRAFSERCKFLDYRALLKTNFIHGLQTPNLFDLLVNEILATLPILLGGRTERLDSIYQRVQNNVPRDHRYRNKLKLVDKACSDLNLGLVNHLPGIVTEANRLIVKMGYTGLSFRLQPSIIKYDRDQRSFTGREINLFVELFGKPIPQPQLFLNEAKLTALALSIYLGAALHVLPQRDASSTIRLLVLDDVLIGLDLVNRIPVLRLLKEEFRDWQVVLMTYDKVWFDLAKENTENTNEWTYLTLRDLKQAGQPSRPYIAESHRKPLDLAKKHIEDGDHAAAAVHIRAAFEARLKNVCEKFGVHVPYKPDPKDLKADKLWQAIVDRQRERKSKGEIDFIDEALMNDVEMIRSIVLNELSHSGSSTLVTSEVEAALEIVQRLQHFHFTKIT